MDVDTVAGDLAIDPVVRLEPFYGAPPVRGPLAPRLRPIAVLRSSVRQAVLQIVLTAPGSSAGYILAGWPSGAPIATPFGTSLWIPAVHVPLVSGAVPDSEGRVVTAFSVAGAPPGLALVLQGAVLHSGALEISTPDTLTLECSAPPPAAASGGGSAAAANLRGVMRTALLVSALAWLAAATSAPAQVSARPLVVATKESPPFAMQVDGTWTGLSIELWSRIAKDLGLEYRYQPMDLVPMLEQTVAGEVDAAVAALTITAERERELDFTHSFLASGLGIATRAQESNVVAALTARIFSTELMQAVLALAVVLLLCGLAVWLFERRANPEQFGGRGMRGPGAGFWFSAVTMTTVGYGDKSPVSLGGRVVALIWMFASIIIISSYTAAIASALTVDRMSAAIAGPEDLPGARIGTVTGSSSTGWLDSRGLFYRGYDQVERAMEDLAGEKIDAVVYDAPILKHYAHPHPDLVVLPQVLRREQYAIALPPGSPLRASIDEKLLQVLESEQWTELLARYLGP